eukprot:2736550-Prymnesium_polylepis.1
MPDYVTAELAKRGVAFEQTDALPAALPAADVLYVTRVQRERFASAEEYDAVKGAYVVDAATMAAAKPDMIVLHPLPRVDEIATDFDDDPRAKYFEQMENGMYVRMALLALPPSGPRAARARSGGVPVRAGRATFGGAARNAKRRVAIAPHISLSRVYYYSVLSMQLTVRVPARGPGASACICCGPVGSLSR